LFFGQQSAAVHHSGLTPGIYTNESKEIDNYYVAMTCDRIATGIRGDAGELCEANCRRRLTRVQATLPEFHFSQRKNAEFDGFPGRDLISPSVPVSRNYCHSDSARLTPMLANLANTWPSRPLQL
jgi:hypothetical protein